MSTRVVLRVLPVVLSGLLTLGSAAARAAETAHPEEPPDLKTMVERVKKALDEQSSKAKGAGEVQFPFGHYLAVAPPPRPTGPTETKKPVQAAGMPEFVISGKMKMGRNVKLFIGRSAYGVGDTVEGAKIIEIKDDSAIFEFGGTQYTKPIP